MDKVEECWLLIDLLLTLGQLIFVCKSYCWPTSTERLTQTKQCSVYSQNEDSSQNKKNTAGYFLRGCVAVSVCAV